MINRICSSDFKPSQSIWRVCLSLYKSKVLRIPTTHFITNSMPLEEYLLTIIKKKHLKHLKTSNQYVIRNIYRSLDALNLVNKVVSHFEHLKSETFSYTNSKHTASLEEFWSNMRPNVRRQAYSIVTKDGNSTNIIEYEGAQYWSNDWSEVGFQSFDPTTDFRSMGLLGLHQLVYMSQYHNETAIDILLESNHPRRFFPFAATAINITHFVLTLLLEHRLDLLFYQSLDNNTEYLNWIHSAVELDNISSFIDAYTSTGTGRKHNRDHLSHSKYSRTLLDSLYTIVNDVYVLIYMDFIMLWRERDPLNVMAFKDIFGEVKSKALARYPDPRQS